MSDSETIGVLFNVSDKSIEITPSPLTVTQYSLDPVLLLFILETAGSEDKLATFTSPYFTAHEVGDDAPLDPFTSKGTKDGGTQLQVTDDFSNLDSPETYDYRLYISYDDETYTATSQIINVPES
ncbi:MAG: hypothetical protein AAGD01_15590 [Acidobacteriota bacterium]